MQKSGVVAVIAGPNKGGYYAFKIEGDDGWINIPNKTSAGLEKGDNISFSVEKDRRGYWGVDVDSITKVPVNQGVAGGVQGRESYWQEKAVVDVANHRESRWRGAVHAAISIVELADKMDANPIPKNGKKGDRFDLLLKLVDETARGIYNSYESANAEEEAISFESLTRLSGNDEFEDPSAQFDMEMSE